MKAGGLAMRGVEYDAIESPGQAAFGEFPLVGRS